MNLLIEEWIPVRPLPTGAMKKISLKQLLCGNEAWELCLPRDDMELAAVQLLICMTQALFTPKDDDELKGRIAKRITSEEYDATIHPCADWFNLNHPKFPFMQTRKVAASIITQMDKLFAGLTGAENCCFMNEPGLAAQLCGGCAAIALFNQATCTPGFGGGFKDPLRGGTPITTLVQGNHLRQTVWLNVLSDSEVARIMPWHHSTNRQLPTWMEPIQAGTNHAQNIGFVRGLFWQPAHLELLPPIDVNSFCSCCGCSIAHGYPGFSKAKFSNYSVENTWPHPHSPRTVELKKEGTFNSWFMSFNITAPAWTQLNRFVAQLSPQGKIEGYEPAAVVLQSKKLYGFKAQKLRLLIGGYVRRKASIVDRRHEVFTLNHGWDRHTNVINEIVSLGTAYKEAIRVALFFFCKGMKDKTHKLKGLGDKIELPKVAVTQFYRRSEPTIENTLACIDFENPEPVLTKMRKELRSITEELFEESVRPYLNDPELMKTMVAVRKIYLRNKLYDLEPQRDKGGDNGTTETT
ncbi:MAG: type I-E CRISPR-associated protein Cse1/CasA [Nitrospirae bacterium]|nr:type I-E CRISPR-associated protein Cse1/CasA [Nitrospirota bacterium]